MTTDQDFFEQTFHPVFDVVRTKTGAVSIRNKLVNEIMHNPVGPWAEANALYIDQPHVRETLARHEEREFVIFDVGLGAASNALAALACARSLGERARPLRLVSFERDLELLRFALDHARYFPHFDGNQEILEQLLATKYWSNGQITWELRHGDFLDLIAREPTMADLIFYDPYSPKMNEEMWTTRCFKMLRARCRDPKEGGSSLFTYSIATRIRVSMMLAGFHVGYGDATGTKIETTEASTEFSRLAKPLAQAWLNRWRRSHVRNSYDCQPGQEATDDRLIEEHMESVLLRLKPSISTVKV